MQTPSPWWRRLSGQVWKVFGFLGTMVILSLSINVVSTWFTSPKGSIPSDSPLAGFLVQWPLVLSIGCCLFLVALLAKILSREPTSSLVSSAATVQMQQNREQMLRILRQNYSELNDQSLQGIVQLELGLANSLAAVQNTTTLLLRQVNQSERILPPGTTIVEAYEQAAHRLLILGKPGAGKSTLLYQLGFHLVEQAELNEAALLPILMPLSSWAIKRRPLQDWIREQLSSRLYKVPPQVSQQWIRSKQILPLLDGLDEMEAPARAACITAINKYQHEHLQPLVVCSRADEYDTASTDEQLALNTAVVVQPLSLKQVDTHLATLGKSLAALRASLKKNMILAELATTPLMLQILILAYQGITMRELSHKEAQLRWQIWDDYLQHMVNRKGDAERYPLDLTKTWLRWLARQLKGRNQVVFYIEHIQKDWLPAEKRYQWSLSLIFASLVSFFFGLIYITALSDPLPQKILHSLYIAIFHAFLISISYLIIFPFIHTFSIKSNFLNKVHFSHPKMYKILEFNSIIFYGLFIGSLHFLFLIFFIHLQYYAFLHGACIGIAYILVGRLDRDVQPVVMVIWSWKGLWKRFFIGLLLGLLFSISVSGLIFSLVHHKVLQLLDLLAPINIIPLLLLGTAIGSGLGVIFSLVGGVSYKALSNSEHFPPNQGIRRSVRNSFLLGALSAFLVGLIAALTFGPVWIWAIKIISVFNHEAVSFASDSTWEWGISIGIAAGFVIFLRNGGAASIQHILLRFWLWQTHTFPWKTVAFLDDATDRIFLRHVGGGYSFIHRMLSDYFAELDTETPVIPGAKQTISTIVQRDGDHTTTEVSSSTEE